MTFGLNIITPFSGVTLEVGGAVETYWKSTAIPATDVPRPWSVSTMPKAGSGSTNTNPSSQPVVTKNRSLTISSIEGDYLYLVVQVTQDMQPVAYPHWKLPGDKFDLQVPNLTLSQFDKLAVELGRKVDTRKQKPTTYSEWYSLLKGSMLSLAELLSVSRLARARLKLLTERFRSSRTISVCVLRWHTFLAFVDRHPTSLCRTSMPLSTAFFARSTRNDLLNLGMVVGGELCLLLSPQTSALL